MSVTDDKGYLMHANPVLSLFMVYIWMDFNMGNRTGVSNVAGTTYPARAPKLTPLFLLGFVLLSLEFCESFFVFSCPIFDLQFLVSPLIAFHYFSYSRYNGCLSLTYLENR